MSEEKSEIKVLAIRDPKPLEELEEVQREYQMMLEQTTGEFQKMFMTANAVSAMRKVLTDDIVGRIKALENTRLGFRTDRPAKGNDKGGYPVPVVRECIIEAALQGIKLTGNEMNIIANNLYITKEGFTGKMMRSSLFGRVQILYGVPEIDERHKRAIVSFEAEWVFNGKKDTLKDKIPVIWNQYLSDDAIIGKAERKIRSRIWSQATGQYLADGEVDGGTIIDVTPSEPEGSLSDQVRPKEEPDAVTPEQTPDGNGEETAAGDPEDQLSQHPLYVALAEYCAGDEEQMVGVLNQVLGVRGKRYTLRQMLAFDPFVIETATKRLAALAQDTESHA